MTCFARLFRFQESLFVAHEPFDHFSPNSLSQSGIKMMSTGQHAGTIDDVVYAGRDAGRLAHAGRGAGVLVRAWARQAVGVLGRSGRAGRDPFGLSGRRSPAGLKLFLNFLFLENDR